MKDRFARMKERMKVSVKNSTTKGNRHLNLPENVVLWEPKAAGKVALNIFVYPVTKPGHPDELTAMQTFVPGEDLWHRRPYAVHRNIGGGIRSAVCPKKTFNLPCPICEEADRLANISYKDNEELIKALRPESLCLYNIYTKEGWKIFNTKPGKFANKLESVLNKGMQPVKNDVKDDMYVEDGPEFSPAEYAGFACYTEGLTVLANFVHKTYNGNEYFEAESISFKKRQNLPEEKLDEAPKLDDLFITASYDEIKEMFVAGDDEPQVYHRAKSVKHEVADEWKDDTEKEPEDDWKDEEPPEVQTPKVSKPEEDGWGDVEPPQEKPKRTKKKEPAPEDKKLEEAKAKVDEVFADADDDDWG